MDTFIELAKNIFFAIAISTGIISAPTPVKIDIPANQKINIIESVEKPNNIDIKKDIKTSVATIKEPAPLSIKKVLTEKELRTKKPLDPMGVFALTNLERVKNGLKPLIWNEKLSNSANIKAKDMINRQYFAHKSPDGTNVDDLARKVKYNYSLVGENLAMGDFLSNQDVVNGWMNSPGHRANILKENYTEIGISAIEGIGDGHKVWYSVQEFGRPAPNCIKPDTNLELIIKETNIKISSISNELIKIKVDIESGKLNYNDLNTLVSSYNNLAKSSNDLYYKVGDIINSYNKSVKEYNTCISKENYIIGTST